MPPQPPEFSITGQEKTRTVLCWINLGPYHIARARALSQHVALTVVEIAGVQRKYSWAVNRQQLPFDTVLLSEGAWEDQNIVILIGKCWRTLNRLNPDVLVIPGYANPIAITMAAWGCLRTVPRILMSESTSIDRPRSAWKEKAKSLLVKILYSAAVFGGKPQLRYLEELGFTKEKTAPFYNVVDNEFFTSGVSTIRRQQVASDFNLPSQYFLYVGRLAKEKNLPPLLQAFAKYRSRGGLKHLALAGDGPLKHDLNRLAEALNLMQAVHFAGRKDSSELLPYYAFATALILPSISEPWGLVVNEAMACGLPILASTKCGCVEDLVTEDENGYLFDPQSEDQILACLNRMSNLTAEEEFQMRTASEERIKKYSPESWATSLTDLIRKL